MFSSYFRNTLTLILLFFKIYQRFADAVYFNRQNSHHEYEEI